MKLCKDCFHSRSDGFFCEHPSNGLCLTDGKPKARFAILERENTSRCGPEGLHYTPIPTPTKKSWWKIFK